MAELLWPGGPSLEGAAGVFPLSVDAILLADFARPGAKDRVLDLGTGGGVVPVLLGWGQPGLEILGVESDPAACALARENFRRNQTPAQVLRLDLRQYRQGLSAGGFDLTVSNPPYFRADSGGVSRSLPRARSDQGCTILELCAAAAWATRWGGRVCLVYRPESLAALFSALKETGLEPKRLRPVHHCPGRPANLILVEARRGGGPGLKWEPDLYLFTAEGAQTPELRRIYHREKEDKPWPEL